MDGRENAIYNMVLTHFQEKYPNRSIEVVNDFDRQIVCVDGDYKFCVTGYNLLYCLKKLTECLEDELL